MRCDCSGMHCSHLQISASCSPPDTTDQTDLKQFNQAFSSLCNQDINFGKGKVAILNHMRNHFLWHIHGCSIPFICYSLAERSPSNNNKHLDHCYNCIWVMGPLWCPRHSFLSRVLTRGDTRCEWMTFTAVSQLCGKAAVLFTSNTNSLRSPQEPPSSSYSSTEHSFLKKGSWHSSCECIIWPFLYFSPPLCRFITRFVRTHWSILGRALRSVSNCKLKCHFTFLQTLVTSGLASSAGCTGRKVSERLFSHRLTFRSYSPVCIKCHSWGFGRVKVQIHSRNGKNGRLDGSCRNTPLQQRRCAIWEHLHLQWLPPPALSLFLTCHGMRRISFTARRGTIFRCW